MTLEIKLYPGDGCSDCRARYRLWWERFVERYAQRPSGAKRRPAQPRPLACADCVDAEQARRFVARAQGAAR